MKRKRTLLACMLVAIAVMAGCASQSGTQRSDVIRVDTASSAEEQPAQASSSSEDAPEAASYPDTTWNDLPEATDLPQDSIEASSAEATSAHAEDDDPAAQLRKKLHIKTDFREEFAHGPKPAKYQKYIVLHDTEGEAEAASVIEYWDSSDAGVAAHFIVNKDGSIMQCVKLDKIAHHAGFGDAGHNELYGVEDESRDDKVGTTEIGDWAPDYGMNSYSIGIEMVHYGGEGDYPEKQLKAVDALIAYIDAYYGFESEIIDHKAWRTGNSDTSEEFADYLENYQDHRTHD